MQLKGVRLKVKEVTKGIDCNVSVHVCSKCRGDRQKGACRDVPETRTIEVKCEGGEWMGFDILIAYTCGLRSARGAARSVHVCFNDLSGHYDIVVSITGDVALSIC